MTVTIEPPLKYEKQLSEWVSHITQRFPKQFDAKLRKGLHVLLGNAPSSFFETRSSIHLKRLLLTQFFIQKEIEKKLNQGKRRALCLRIFSVSSHLCIAFALSDRAEISDQFIMQLATNLIPSLKAVRFSSYQWKSPRFPYFFSYLELSKMRGRNLLAFELKKLESNLKKEIENQPSALSSIFLPYNHEESYRQILLLQKEIHSGEDLPQVSIHFKEQNPDQLEFLICLVSPTPSSTLETLSYRLPLSTHFVSHLKKEMSAPIPSLAEVCSLSIPAKNFNTSGKINLLNARDLIAQLLRDLIGPFRDVNGGLFASQKRQFEKLRDMFSQTISQFSLFAAPLFYAIFPFEAQISLDFSLFEELFQAFSKLLLENTSPFLIKKLSPHVLIVRSQALSTIIPYFAKTKKLEEEKQITAYANLNIASHHYLCLLDKTGQSLVSIQSQFASFYPLRFHPSTLRLAFQEGCVPSLHPYYLAQETRGYTLGHLLFEGLIRLTPQCKIEYAGCEAVVPSKKNRRYLFKLRLYNWSNGEKVTAEHYEKSWKNHFIQGSRLSPLSLLQYAEAIQEGRKPIEALGVKALDDEYLQVDLEREDSAFLQKLVHPIFFPTLHPSSEPKAFNGPYLVQKRTDQYLLLEKNHHYWDKKTVFFNQIEVRSESASSKKIYEQFQRGETDWIGPPFNSHFLEISPSLLKKRKLSRPYLIHFNTKHFPLSSPFIRRALSLVISRRSIAEHILIGTKPLYSPFPGSSSLPVVEEDLIKGKELFEKGLKALGLTRATFPLLKLSCFRRIKNKELGEYLQATWQKTLGIQVQLEVQEWNIFYQQLEQGSFEMGGLFKALATTDFLTFLKSFASEATNHSRWSNLHYIQVLNKMNQASSKGDKLIYLKQIEDLLMTYMPFIPLLTQSYFYQHRSDLENYIINEEWKVDFRFARLRNTPT